MRVLEISQVDFLLGGAEHDRLFVLVRFDFQRVEIQLILDNMAGISQPW